MLYNYCGDYRIDIQLSPFSISFDCNDPRSFKCKTFKIASFNTDKLLLSPDMTSIILCFYN